MNRQNDKIQIERFIDRKCIAKDICVAFLFLTLFFAIGLFEKNLKLPDNGLGLLQHENIWIFLAMNMIIPIIISKSFKALECNIDKNTYWSLKNNFASISNHKSMEVLWLFSRTVGFCCFIGNTLQNAKVINQLPFDYWDSINYPVSYVVSRFYKLYLFSIFIPTILVYAFILIKSLSKLVIINETEKYPIANYTQLNALCNLGLNLLLAITVPFTISSIAVFLIHDRFDITTITAITIPLLFTGVSLYAYILLIKNFYVSLANYKKKHIKRIDDKLSKIYQYILNSQLEETDSAKLELYLKEVEYLCQIKENIEKQSKFPLGIKALMTTATPLLPTVLKIILSLEIPFSN